MSQENAVDSVLANAISGFAGTAKDVVEFGAGFTKAEGYRLQGEAQLRTAQNRKMALDLAAANYRANAQQQRAVGSQQLAQEDTAYKYASSKLQAGEAFSGAYDPTGNLQAQLLLKDAINKSTILYNANQAALGLERQASAAEITGASELQAAQGAKGSYDRVADMAKWEAGLGFAANSLARYAAPLTNAAIGLGGAAIDAIKSWTLDDMTTVGGSNFIDTLTADSDFTDWVSAF